MWLRLSRLSLTLIVVGVVSGLAVHYRTTTLRYLNQFTALVTYPFLALQRPVVATLHNLSLNRQTMQQLRDRVNELEVENQHLRSDLVKVYAERDTYQLSDTFAQFCQRYTYADAVPARILLKQLDEREHSFFIDVGSRVGVEPDMVVAVDRNLVGKVTEVYPWHSKVMLVTDRRCNVACYCVTTGAVGIHEGANDTERTAVTHVEHVATIHHGDFVLSSGKGLVFPLGFCLGKVSAITQDGLWHTLTLQPLVDFATLDYCSVFHAGQRSVES